MSYEIVPVASFLWERFVSISFCIATVYYTIIFTAIADPVTLYLVSVDLNSGDIMPV